MHPVWEKLANYVMKDYDEEKQRKEASTRHLFWFLLAVIVVAAAAIYVTCAQPGGIPY